MKREDLDRAIFLINEIEHLEKVLDHIEKCKYDNCFGAPYLVQFTDKLTYRFPDNVAYSMFNNILQSSVEIELEKLNKKLEEL